MGTQRVKLIAIFSNKYSGSTITDMMLGAHSRVLSLTELVAFVANHRQPFACKSCQPPESCPVWTKALTDRLLQIGARKEVYDAIADATGLPVLVDSSKLIESWYAFTLKNMNPADIVAVHLSKSPEAYAGSEKHKSHVSSLSDMDDIADRWWRTNGSILDYLTGLGATVVTVRYQDVVDHPQAVLDTILRGVGLTYEPGIENFWDFRQHPLWGNKGARSHFDSTDSRPDRWTDESDTQKKLYTEQHQTLFRDEKWRGTLTRADVDRLWNNPRVAAMAHLLGYAHPFTDEGVRLNERADSWTPHLVIGTPDAKRERADRHRDIGAWEGFAKIRRKLRILTQR